MDTSLILLATGLVSSLVANAGQLLVLKRQKAEAENKLSIAELMRAAAFASRDHWQVQYKQRAREISALDGQLATLRTLTSGAMLRDPKTGKVTGRADW